MHQLDAKQNCFLLVQLLLGRQRYQRHRRLIVSLAKTAYVFHAGGVSQQGLLSPPLLHVAYSSHTLLVPCAPLSLP